MKILLMMMVHQNENRFFNLFNGIDDLSVEDWKNKNRKEAKPNTETTIFFKNSK